MPQLSGLRRIHYFMVILLVNLSGNMALISGSRQDYVLLLAFVVVAIHALLLRRLHTCQFLLVFLAFLMVLLFQAVSLDFYSLPTMAGFLVKLTIAAAVVSTVPFFRIVYARVMVWLTLVSFAFHIPAVLAGTAGISLYEYFRPLAAFVGAESTGVNERINILLHNFMGGEHLYRNSGVFWEPGAFSGYLILSLLLLATVQNDLPKKVVKRWRSILVAGVLSTLSTAGYLLLPFVIFTFWLASKHVQHTFEKKLLWILGFFVVLIPLAFYASSLEFIGPKIAELYERAVFQDSGWHLSRFGTMIFDWEYIRESPFLGWGQHNSTQFALHPNLDHLGVGNGLTGFMRQMGVVGFSIFLFAYWHGLGRLKISGIVRIWCILLTLVQLNGELFLLHPIYLGLMFIGLERQIKNYNPQLIKPTAYGNYDTTMLAVYNRSVP